MKRNLMLFCLLLSTTVKAQKFEACFNAKEYADLLQLCFKGFSDTSFNTLIASKSLRYNYKLISITPEVGLLNKCAMYWRSDGVGIINLRGTIQQKESWLANFFSGMIAANGTLQLNDTTTFNYKVANAANAYVHVGWMLGVGYLSPYINSFVDSLLSKGVTQFIVTGHSQGGALAFLTTSYLYYKYKSVHPSIQFKTYASAAPKPGNLYYAYDFDFVTANGFGFRIINSEDWVPETPLTVQTLSDINAANPIKDAKQILKQQKLLVRWYLGSVYNKMNKASYKTMKHYKNILGDKLYAIVQKTLPALQKPNLVYSSNYFTTGTPIILMATERYKEKFVFTRTNYFVHHMYEPYVYLLNTQYLE